MAELAPAERAGEFRLGFAGDTFNTAWYLARIAPEVDVSYLTAVGDDAISQDMRSFIRSSGISDTHVKVISGATVGLYLIHLENGERSFAYWRENSAARQLARDRAALDTAMAGAALIYLSGITLAILDQGSRENLFAALRHARSSGAIIAFDTNLRPKLWSDPEMMKTTTMAAAAQSDIVLPSYEDEASWFGDGNPVATLDRYASTGAAHVVVKNGAETVVFQTNGQRGKTGVDPASNVIDTTAAGDSFNAGILTSILRGHDIAEGIAQGCRLAGQVVQQKGALVPVANDQCGGLP